MSDSVIAARKALVKAIWACIVDASSMNVVMSGPEVNAAMDAYRDAVRADAEAPLRAALEKIANLDYRGNRSTESGIARAALEAQS